MDFITIDVDNMFNNYDNVTYNAINWDDPITPIPPVPQFIDEHGWHWFPDSNGNLFSTYIDPEGNHCEVWRQNDDGSFPWNCSGFSYDCRDIGVEGRRGVFYQGIMVGTMVLDQHLTVIWLDQPEENIQNNINYFNDISDLTESEEDDTHDE